ncbi:MAG: DUF5666 domain-containing protein [Chloroflexota bacterium]|nr:DUF5666 domain-containing protein [Chloroflexota bacterium]
MQTKLKPACRWLLVAGYTGLVAALLACGAVADATASPTTLAAPTVTEAPLLRLEDGAVKVRVQEEGETWLPVAGESTFELVGELQSMEPWMVTGNTFAIRDTTQIDERLQVGDRVRVSGILLVDNTWLASSIVRAGQDEPESPTIVLIGKVNSMDPWVVHGITLDVTADTIITGDIAPDLIVVVEILLLEDGTWEVLSIAPLSTFTEIPGCATVIASVARVSGTEVQFAGWPAILVDGEVAVETESGEVVSLAADQRVLVVVCATEEGDFTMTKIIVLERGEESESSNGGKALVCHKPDKKGGHTLSIATSAVTAHLAHGDAAGACP